MTDELTPRQAQILELIRSHISERGVPPTRAEICEELGFRSPNAAEEHLRALQRKGVIKMVSGSARGIQLTEPLGLPVVGQVAAGEPILAQENIEDHYEINPAIFHPQADYLLRVKGMSMRDAGILDGDLLAVSSSQAEPENGQVVVARIDDEVTVKRFRRRGYQVHLLPENPDFKPIQLDVREQPLAIEGIAVGVIRNGRSL